MVHYFYTLEKLICFCPTSDNTLICQSDVQHFSIFRCYRIIDSALTTLFSVTHILEASHSSMHIHTIHFREVLIQVNETQTSAFFITLLVCSGSKMSQLSLCG